MESEVDPQADEFGCIEGVDVKASDGGGSAEMESEVDPRTDEFGCIEGIDVKANDGGDSE